jgi:hypothetical protein
VISEFQRDGLIETRNRLIAILDRGSLVKQASGPSGLSVDGQLPILGSRPTGASPRV